jgi:hypothetical protein
MTEEILWPPSDASSKVVEENPIKKSQIKKPSNGGLQDSVDPAFANAPVVTLAEAARRSNKSRGTIRSWLADGKIPGARRTDAGWEIPVPSLVASGAWDAVTAPEVIPEPDDVNRVTELEADLARARMELHSEKRLREAAERNADDLRIAMRMLNAGPLQSPEPAKPQQQQRTPINDSWDLTPASVMNAVQKFRRKIIG